MARERESVRNGVWAETSKREQMTLTENSRKRGKLAGKQSSKMSNLFIFCLQLRFLPRWGPISQWWSWSRWNRPCHFAACLLLQCPFLSTPHIHTNTIDVHSLRCRLHSVKERKNGKSSPQQLCQNSFPRIRGKGERESIGGKRASVFQCA